MEYLLTNIDCNLNHINSIYYSDNFHRKTNKLILREGYFSSKNSESLSINEIFKGHPDGIYNLIQYNLEKEILSFTNDKLGKSPVYYYHHQNDFAISNQPWKIIKLISPVKIDRERVREHLYYYTIPSEKQTFIRNLYKIPPASILKYDFKDNELNIKRYWKLKYDFSEPKISEEEALNKLDQDLHASIDRLQQLHPNETIALGNSSGFDSRLMALYCREHGVEIKGFTVCNPASKLGLKSYTYKNAQKIAQYLDFNNQIVPHHPKNLTNRILLDVRNNPFDISQFFKNPYSDLQNLDTMITGQHGAMVGAHWGNHLNNNDPDYIYKYFQYFFEKHKDFKNRFTKFIGKLFSQNNFYPPNSRLDEVISKPPDKLKEYLKSCSYTSFINIFMYYYLTIHDRYGYNAGFESINRTISSFYFYYPFVLDNTFKWKQKYFNNRYLLKKLLLKKDSFLAHIPNSDLEKIQSNSAVNKLFRPLKLLFRNSGMNFKQWVKDKNYINKYKNIMRRPNPIYDEVVNKDKLLKYKFYKSMNGGGDFLKTKVILDIIHYKEYDKLSRDEFLMS